jgi:hypothetical protein
MDSSYDICRQEYVKKCIDEGKIIFFKNDWLSLVKTIGNYHQVFKYCDEYCHTRYYTLHTYLATHRQACRAGPYESLGFWSDENGNPLCKNGDPFNEGDVNNTGTKIDELHYESYFDLRDECCYFWDKNLEE